MKELFLRVAAAYWWVRHSFWDVREWLFVKEAMKQLKHSNVVYIHPKAREMRAALVRIEMLPDEDDLSVHVDERWDAHHHLEGRAKC